MKGLLTTFGSAKISTQITVLVVGALVLAHAAMAASFFLLDPVPPTQRTPLMVVDRLLLLARMLDAEASADRRAALLVDARYADPSLSILTGATIPETTEPDARMLRYAQTQMDKVPELFLARLRSATGERASAAATRLSDGTVLAVALPAPSRFTFFLSPLAITTLTFLASAVTVLSLWAARQLTAPLVRFASAAEQFSTEAEGTPFLENGPLEVRRAARALNEMQARIFKLMADRTRMLAAVSHDLRTPITRLRLRAEDIASIELRSQILRDLSSMQRLVQSALSFLHGQHKPFAAVKTDLPALVQTVCDGFSDMGHSINYIGPVHLYVTCEPDQVMRAVENLVDNGLKFGTTVTVRAMRQGGSAIIEIQDDGPGIADADKIRVIEPFYRGDDARNLNDGDRFGLGLSIAHSIIEGNGGTLELADNDPRGLLARIVLPVRSGCEGKESGAISL